MQEYYFDGEECADCPLNAFCPGHTSAPVTARGYWRVPWRTENDTEPRLECLSKDSCLGPEAHNEVNFTEGCKVFHRGVLCAACARGAYRATGTYDCVACSPDEHLSYAYVLLLLIGVLIIIAAVTKLTLLDGGEAAPVDVVVAKITVNHFVIASAAATFPLRWPGFVQGLMAAMSIMSASAMGDSAFSIDCVTRNGVMRPIQAWCVTMVAAPPLLMLGAFVIFLVMGRRQGPHFQVTTLVILILGHPTICKAAFALLSCRHIGGRPFLESDLDISCTSSEYFTWGLGLGLPTLIVYGVGIPAYYFLKMLALYRREQLENNQAVYGFLFAGYDKERWWYELWNSVRKAFFTGAGILLAPRGPAIRAWGALLLLVVFIVVFSKFSPYREPWLNALERDALWVDATTLFLGLALFLNDTNSVDAKSDALGMILSVTIVAINVWYLVRVAQSLRAHSAYAGHVRRGLALAQQRLGRSQRALPRQRGSRRWVLEPAPTGADGIDGAAHVIKDGDMRTPNVELVEVTHISGQSGMSVEVYL